MQEPDNINVVLDSDYPADYYWDNEESFVLWNGFESGCVLPLTLESLPNPASVMEDGNFLGYFVWRMVEHKGLVFTKVNPDQIKSE